MPINTTTYYSKSEITQKSKLSEFVGILSELTKFRITFFVSVTTYVGFILYSGTINLDFLLPTIGVLILASGASALNEYQERNSDYQMERTKVRPIPSGRISAFNALFISLILILIGSTILALHSITVLLLGLFTLVWYNGVYTPLKQFTAFAIIPGSLVGALPPVIGWVASGGGLFDNQILALASFMFIWQIPHFWLLILMYDHQYREAGFPTLSNLFSYKQISQITFAWIVILVFSSSLIYLSNLSVSIISNLFLILAGLITLYFSSKVMLKNGREIYKKSFFQINAYVLFVLIVISLEKII